MKFLALCLFAVVSTANGIFFGGQAWDGLRTTWSLNPFNNNAFQGMPRDRSTDSMNGFVQKDNFCTSTNTQFRGKRFWESSDPSLVLLFDINGYIAGMQSMILQSQYPTPPPISTNFAIQSFTDTDETKYWVLTVYFVDPSIICTTGRTAAQFSSQGTGTGLWIQVGPNPLKDTVQMPLLESDLPSTAWVKGKCFYTMGQHYWYNVSTGMDCNYFFPYCLLYNSGKLDAFCFATNANVQDKHYDDPHPTPSILSQFMTPVPTCMSTNPSFAAYTTMHVYMNDWPRSTSNC